MKNRRDLGYRPNRIPRSQRMKHVLFSILLLGYVGCGVAVDDLFIPAKRSRGMHLHGEPAWVMYGAMICAALNLAAVVVDHHDRRNNERHYRVFARITQSLGWIAFFTALALDLFEFRRATRH